MATTIPAVIRMRRDSAANWASENPILTLGEGGLNLDAGIFKVGDGTTPWNDLNYYMLNDDGNFAVAGIVPRNATAAAIAATPIPHGELFTTSDTNEIGLGVSGDTNGGMLVKNMPGNDFVVPIAPEMLRVWNNFALNVPDTPGSDDLGFASLELQTGTVTNTTTTRKVGVLLTLPRSYRAGEDITFRISTTIPVTAEVSMELDVECHSLSFGSGDLCLTDAHDINTSSDAFEFEIDGTNIQPGDTMRVIISIAIDDTGGSGAAANLGLFTRGNGFRFPGRIA